MTHNQYEPQALGTIKAEIVRLQERADQLTELEESINNLLKAYSEVINKSKEIAPEEVDNIKSRILLLIQGDDDNDDGNQPYSPDPSNDGDNQSQLDSQSNNGLQIDGKANIKNPSKLDMLGLIYNMSDIQSIFLLLDHYSPENDSVTDLVEHDDLPF